MLVYTNATALLAITIIALALSLHTRARVPHLDSSVFVTHTVLPLEPDNAIPRHPDLKVNAVMDITQPVFLAFAPVIDEFQVYELYLPIHSDIPDGVDGFRLELNKSQWPVELHQELEDIARCESQFNMRAVGDSGFSLGWLQIHTGYHPLLAKEYDLHNGSENLDAGWIVYQQAGKSFKPWSCWSGS